MSDQTGREQPGRRRRATRKRRPSLRLVVLVVLVLVVVVVAAGGWLAVRGLDARRQLDAARAGTIALRADLLDGHTDEARVTEAAVRTRTARARALTSGPLWRVAGALPFVGHSASAVTTTAAAVDDATQTVLPTLVEESSAVEPASIRVAGDRLDLSRIAAAAPALAAAATDADAAAAKARGVDPSGLPGRLRVAVDQAQSSLDQLASLTDNAADAARLLPPMLGADGPRRYFLAFQTDAEARATGGLIGAYGVLEADHGKLSIVTLGSRSKLDPGDLQKPAIDFGADYTSLYGTDPGLWVNTNLSPHFPYAARLWLAMYHRQGGPALDGAIATDPVALGALLGATGPATLADGTVVTAENAARMTMSTVYARYPNSNAKRDAFLQDVARAVVGNLLRGDGDSENVARALGHAAGAGRLLVYSTDPAEESVLASTPLGGSVAATPGPYVGVFMNNGSASKLDYYVRMRANYALGACPSGSTRSSTLTLTMTNTAPSSGLPAYVTGDGQYHDGTNLDLMAVHLPVGAVVDAARIGGRPLGISPQQELGRPVVTFPMLLRPGQSATVTLALSEPASSVAPRLQVQPLAFPVITSVSGNICR